MQSRQAIAGVSERVSRFASRLSPSRWFWIAILCFLPLHISAVVIDEWFVSPPKPIGDGPDYEAIGYSLSQGNGWSTSFSDSAWRSAYEQAQAATGSLDYSVQLARVGPVVADTNRPPLFPVCIAAVYQCLPRGPIAFGAIRISLACCLSFGCALSVAWGVALTTNVNKNHPVFFSNAVGASLIAIVYSERNLRNYTTDFLTEPLALLLTQAFLMVAWHGSKKGTWQWAAATGLSIAGMYFCRSVVVLWLPLLIPWLWCCYRFTVPTEGALRMSPNRWISVCILAFASISSLWWVRNCWVLESFHLLGSKGATTLLGGYCDESFHAGGEWQFAPEKALRIELESKLDLSFASPTDFRNLELEMGRIANAKAKQWAWNNIHLLPQLMMQRIVTEWNPYTGKAVAMKLLAVFGIVWLLRKNRHVLFWLLGPLVINTVVVAMTYSVGGRFLVPTYGSIYVLAAIGIAAMVTLMRYRTCFLAIRM